MEEKVEGKGQHSRALSKEIKELDALLLSLDDIDKLCAFLSAEMNSPGKQMFTEDMANAFRKNAVDGYAFQMLEECHLDELELNLSLGQKLHLLSKAAKIQRAIRMKRRNRALMKVKCTLHCNDHSSTGTVTLTNSCLKFKFVSDEEKEFDQMPKNCCFAMCGKSAKLTVSGLTRVVDHVDISLIEDCDLQTIDVKKITTMQSAWCLDCICPPRVTETHKKNNYVWISLCIPEEIMNTSMGGTEATSVLRVEIEKKEEAIMFKDKLIDAMEEVQFDEGGKNG